MYLFILKTHQLFSFSEDFEVVELLLFLRIYSFAVACSVFFLTHCFIAQIQFLVPLFALDRSTVCEKACGTKRERGRGNARRMKLRKALCKCVFVAM